MGRCEKNGKKSAQFGRFFFFAPPCMVKENFTGSLLEIATPRTQIFPYAVEQTIDKSIQIVVAQSMLISGYSQ
ncbi:hypothetical protein [Paraburkholderia sp. BL6669N2]|uniref:hypothetical protein n=1 Tax=Paraburkholderia sp. BL6669N2 TaxID=1938807 RepID=UPI0011C042E2|nr:hypothetical protein [Paraburkholderia sp. BL6669N2]